MEFFVLILIALLYVLANLPKKKRAQPKRSEPIPRDILREIQKPVEMEKAEAKSPPLPLAPPPRSEIPPTPVSEREFVTGITQRHIESHIGEEPLLSERFVKRERKRKKRKGKARDLLRSKKNFILAHEILQRPYKE